MNKKKVNSEMANIHSIVDYEFYLAINYDFYPMNINEEDIWDKVISCEGRKEKHLVWYNKFIKKYAKKKLIPKKKLVKALLIAGCEQDKANEIVYGIKSRELLFYFRKMPKKKKRKPRVFYQGQLSKREKETMKVFDNENLKKTEEDLERLS